MSEKKRKFKKKEEKRGNRLVDFHLPVRIAAVDAQHLLKQEIWLDLRIARKRPFLLTPENEPEKALSSE